MTNFTEKLLIFYRTLLLMKRIKGIITIPFSIIGYLINKSFFFPKQFKTVICNDINIKNDCKPIYIILREDCP